MRCKLSQDSLEILFITLNDLGYSTTQLAGVLGIHQRTLRDWKRGKFTIPKDNLDTLIKLAAINRKSLEIKLLQCGGITRMLAELAVEHMLKNTVHPGHRKAENPGVLPRTIKGSWPMMISTQGTL